MPYRTIDVREHYRSRPKKRSASEKYMQKARRRKRKQRPKITNPGGV